MAFEVMDNFERANLLRIVVSNFSLEGGKAFPDWKKPFDALAKNSQNKRIYPQGNSNLMGQPTQTFYQLPETFTG
jgi:hypothetical protein